MKNIIYADVLFIENLFMNYLLLYLLKRFCKCKAQYYKLIAAAAFGALYVFIVFFPSLHVFTSILMKFIISVIMIIIAFSHQNIRTYIKLLTIFYIEAFFIGGCILGIYYYRKQTNYSINDITDISAQFIIVMILFATLLVKIGFDFFENHYMLKNNKIELQILLDKKVCSIQALVDTGNSLKDPLTNLPVVIVYFKAIYDLLPENMTNSIKDDGSCESLMELIMLSSLKHRIRVLPFRALGVDNGVLPGIKIDMLVAKYKNRTTVINNPIIALYDKPISEGDDYQALAYPEILKGVI